MHKIRVLWICNVSNPKIRSNITIDNCSFDFYLRKILKKQISSSDYGIWNSNAIKVMEQCDDIELHVVAPQSSMKNRIEEFVNSGVYYHIINDSFSKLFYKGVDKVTKHFSFCSWINRKRIISIIKRVKPDIIHIIGAENPNYSISALDVPRDIPVIVQLQTVVNAPEFLKKYPKMRSDVLDCERKVLCRADYIACSEADSVYRTIIEKNIRNDGKYLDLELANGADIIEENTIKNYDFVYFSANIAKAFDIVLESFILAHKIQPSITLDVIGHYENDYKKTIDARIMKEGIEGNIKFEGHKETYFEVLDIVKRCRIAILPLKVDLISSTIREAMAMGLPVISTITQGTPILNEKRQSVLLSEIDDYVSISNDMIELLRNNNLFQTLRNNAFITISEMFNNTNSISKWIETYKKIYRQIKN